MTDIEDTSQQLSELLAELRTVVAELRDLYPKGRIDPMGVYTAREVSAIVNVGWRIVHAAARTGALRTIKVMGTGSGYRITGRAVLAWLERRGVSEGSELGGDHEPEP